MPDEDQPDGQSTERVKACDSRQLPLALHTEHTKALRVSRSVGTRVLERTRMASVG